MDNLVIEAVAGGAKTSTVIEACRQYVQARGNTDGICFVAYNRHIAAELKAKLPRGVESRTMHSLGLKAIGQNVRNARVVQEKLEGVYDDLYPITNVSREMRGDHKAMRGSIRKVLTLLRNLLLEPTAENVFAVIDRFSVELSVPASLSTSPDLFVERLAKACAHLMEYSRNHPEQVDYDDMIWLPHALDLSLTGYETVFIDETQDLNPAMHEMVDRLAAGGARIIAVGDRHQCVIEGTVIQTPMGSRRVEEIQPGDFVMAADGTGGLRPAKVSAALVAFADDLVVIELEDGATLCTTRNHTHFAGPGDRVANAPVFSERASTTVTMTLLADPQDDEVRHSFSVWSKDPAVAVMFDQSHDPNTIFHIEGRSSSEQVATLLDRLQEIGPVTMSAAANAIPGRPLPFIQAGDVRPGMVMARVFNGHVTPVKVQAVHAVSRNTRVFDLNVEGLNNFVANGIVTHNSIYAFRGATTDSIPDLIRRLDARTLPLSVCYRCPRKVVRWAQQFVPQIEPAPDAPDGWIEARLWEDALAECVPGDLVLARTNAIVAKAAFWFIRRGRKAIVKGRDIGANLKSFIEQFDVSRIADLEAEMAVHQKNEVERLEDRSPGQLEALQDRIDTIKVLNEGLGEVRQLVRRIDTVFRDESAGVVCATAHRAKGLEANRVTIMFPAMMPFTSVGGRQLEPWELQQEENLVYVAITRAQKVLSLALPDRPVLPAWAVGADLDISVIHGRRQPVPDKYRSRILPGAEDVLVAPSAEVMAAHAAAVAATAPAGSALFNMDDDAAGLFDVEDDGTPPVAPAPPPTRDSGASADAPATVRLMDDLSVPGRGRVLQIVPLAGFVPRVGDVARLGTSALRVSAVETSDTRGVFGLVVTETHHPPTFVVEPPARPAPADPIIDLFGDDDAAPAEAPRRSRRRQKDETPADTDTDDLFWD